MAATIEREIKLQFDSAEAAREAILGIGATALRARRLQEDSLLDTVDGMLRARGCALRVRVESGRSLVTFKGPVERSLVKLREEIETIVGDGSLLLKIFEEVGFRVWFRYEKYREEFTVDDVIIALDETPVGTFVEIEGGEQGIAATAEALGRGPQDYVILSYRALFQRHCEERGLALNDMLFDENRHSA